MKQITLLHENGDVTIRHDVQAVMTYPAPLPGLLNRVTLFFHDPYVRTENYYAIRLLRSSGERS